LITLQDGNKNTFFLAACISMRAFFIILAVRNKYSYAPTPFFGPPLADSYNQVYNMRSLDRNGRTGLDLATLPVFRILVERNASTEQMGGLLHRRGRMDSF
jgi:hypothetical protein